MPHKKGHLEPENSKLFNYIRKHGKSGTANAAKFVTKAKQNKNSNLFNFIQKHGKPLPEELKDKKKQGGTVLGFDHNNLKTSNFRKY